MCCGRGYTVETIQVRHRCDCKYYWCCYVKCSTCTKRVDVYRCRWNGGHLANATASAVPLVNTRSASWLRPMTNSLFFQCRTKYKRTLYVACCGAIQRVSLWKVYGRLGDKTFGRQTFRRQIFLRWPFGRHGSDVWARAIGCLNVRRRDVWTTKMKRYA